MVKGQIKTMSERSRDNVKECISKVLSELRERIVSEIALDEERKKNNPIQSSNTVTMKRKTSTNVFEKLGFPEGMTYGHRSSLRKECSRFLRFAYSIDFLSYESLANIYIQSVQEMLYKLSDMNDNCDMDKIMNMAFDEASQQQPMRGREPLFYISLTLNDKNDIPEDEVVPVEIDDFNLPPRGTSKEDDFDVLAHLELEPEIVEKDEDEEE
jgi:hypothetical protein